ncbi:Mu transposase C-terminal domain-containing protein [Vibrio parahaemolyticus]|uniref:Mu transposase C-terminal domain-containing protein n=1 Tax=Vibrio parahaemolyticus TaxID=670 RepID=UPI003891D34F
MYATVKELAGLPAMPANERNVRIQLSKVDETFKRKRQGSKAYEYHIDCLPAETKQYLIAEQTKAEIAKQREAAKAHRADVVPESKESTSEEKSAAIRAMDGWNPARRERCFVRYEVLNACEQYICNVSLLGIKRTQATRDFVAMFNAHSLPFDEKVYSTLDNSLSDVSLRRWRKLHREGGIAALDRLAHVNKGRCAIEDQPEMKSFSVAMLAEYPHIMGKKLHEAIAAQFKSSDLIIPGMRSVQYWLKSWKEKNASLFESIRNPDEWKNKYMSAMGSASANVHELNQLWELDATPADLQITLPDGSKRRYHITALIDVWSRRPMMLVTETPRTESNAALMRRGIIDFDKPTMVKIDNGSDYVSRGMIAVLDSLNIDYEICPPFSPWKKPHIERFFRHFSHDVLELKPGFVGHNVAERKAIEARKTFADRLMKKDEVIDVTMTPEELQTFCDQWINSIYMHKRHESLEMTPFEKMSSYQGSILRVEDERALDQLLSIPTQGGTRTVTKKGVKIDNIFYIAEALTLYVGQQVLVRYDKDNLGQIVVSALDGEFICVASNHEYAGIERTTIAVEGKRLQRAEIARAKREIKAAKTKFKTKDIADKIMQSAMDDNADVLAFPKPTETFTNTALQGASDAANALERKASDELPPLTQTDMDVVHQMMRDDQQQDENEESRFRRWLTLNDKVTAGEALDEASQFWKDRYETTPEFKGRYMVWEEFGDSPFRQTSTK